MAKNGRPSKYTEEILDKCQEYLDTYELLNDAIPSHIGMFLFINVGKTTAYNWSDQSSDVYQPAFRDILAKCMDMQHQVLINKGLNNEHNAAITKLVLGKHGYHDKVDQDVTSKGEKVTNNFVIVPVRGKDE